MTPEDRTFLGTKVPLLASFDSARLDAVLQQSRISLHEQGEIVIAAGEEIHSLGIIIEGQVIATAPAEEGGNLVLGKLEPGDTFGEMALMTGDPAPVDLLAERGLRIAWVPLTLFQSHIMADPKALQQISRTIGLRLQQVMGDPVRAAAITRQDDIAGLLELKGERPERILVLNTGSSSLKYSYFDTEHPENRLRGQIERIGMSGTRLYQRGPKGNFGRELPQAGYSEAFTAMLEALADTQTGVISGARDISTVGHRVVHGGEKFTTPVVVDDAVISEIEGLSRLAPLHNPLNVSGIREAMRVFPAVPHVAVFDTAFHATLPSYAYLYGLPYELYETKGIRRYGFHGNSHNYVALAAAQFLNRRPRELKVVSCHLGNGASLCAIDHGRSVDTSMGLTPSEGLIMGTRCGDLDPGIFSLLEPASGMTSGQFDQMINRQGGLLGLSGISGDMREIEEAAEEGNPRALVALKAFCYRVRKYIGSYVAAMGGLDVLIFTGGIGEGSAGVRATALQGLQCMGIHLDDIRNREASSRSRATRVSTDGSTVTVLVIATDEERMIARETLQALRRDYLVRASGACRNESILIEVSAHHIHLTQEHVEELFGPGHQLTRHADLSQPGQFACKEQLSIVGPKGRIDRVRVLGPTRKMTQVEIAMTEQFKLGIHPPIRESGDIKDSPGCTLEGPAGSIQIGQGVICALRHVHMTPADALRYGLRDKSTVRIRIPGHRELVFGDVRVRVDPNFALAMHIDTDEANAAGIATGAQGYIDGIQQEDSIQHDQ